MKKITHLLNDVMMPRKALIVYQSAKENDNSIYLESYDMDRQGKPINAHPLSIGECAALAKSLDSMDEFKSDYLLSKGVMPEKVLYLDAVKNGFAVWHTPPREVKLLFKKGLSIPCGRAHIPGLVWKAGKEQLTVFAVKGKKKPDERTPLYFAPFFNLYQDGSVCMGTVDIAIEEHCCLEEFMSLWEHYFFESYFSHLIAQTETIKGNMVQLWQQQVGTDRPFPEDVLIKTPLTVQSILR